MDAQLCRDNLIRIAKAYAKAEGITLKTVSRRAYGNPNFFAELMDKKDPASPGLDKIEKVVSFFRANWPDGVQWPCLSPLYMNREP